MAGHPKSGAKRRVLWAMLAAAAVVLLGGGYWLARGGEVRVPLGQDALQDAVSRAFPVEKKQSGITIHLKEPKLRFPEGEDRVGLGMLFDLRAGPVRSNGVISADGKLRYDAETAGFFLSDVKIRSFEVRNVPRAISDIAKRAAEPALNASFAHEPIYRLSDKDLTGQVARKTLKRISILNGEVVAVFGVGVVQ